MAGNDDMNSTVQEILRLEGVRSKAITSGDHATLNQLLSPEHVYVHCSGRIDTRESYIDRILTGKSNYYRLDFSNVQVRLLGETALVWGDVVMELIAPSRPRVLVLRFLNVWARGASGWTNVHWISTPNSPPA